MNKIENIITTNHLNNQDADGYYEFKKRGDYIEWNGIKHIYHSSGLCRRVYVSPCRTYVLKIAKGEFYEELEKLEIEEFLKDATFFKYLSVSLKHNYLEALCYSQCPKEYKQYLAKTEMLTGFVLKQEFVEVKKVSYSPELREAGITSDNRIVIFDYDIFMGNFQVPRNGYYYGKLPDVIKNLEKQLK